MTKTPVSDDRTAWLVERAQRGERAALDELVSEHVQLVYNIVGRALAGHPDTDDVVQETLLQVVRGLGTLRDPASFRSWTVAIAMNQIRRCRRGAQPVQDLASAHSLGDPGADFAELTIVRLGLSDQRREVAEATRWLDPDDRDLLALWWLETAGEISRGDLVAALELSAQHAAVRVQRMKGQLDNARLVVRALRNRTACPTLSALASDWDGAPSALWRKRIGRHARECEACWRQRKGLVPAEGLLVGLAMVPPPRTAPGRPSTHSPSTHSPVSHSPVSHRASAGRARGRGHRRARSPWRLLAVATGVGAAAVAGVLALDQSPSHPQATLGSSLPRAAAAAIASTGSPSPTTAPSASGPSASATASPSAARSAAPTTARPRASAAASTAPALAPADVTPAPGSTDPGLTGPEQQVLTLINQARTAQGLAPLTVTSGLQASAAQHDTTMADGCGLSHQCPGEPAIGQRETDQGVHWTAAGENIGDGGPVGDDDSDEASMAVGLTQDMLNEKPPNDGHRANILSTSYTHIGISVVRDSSGMVWLTQDFSN